MAKYKIVHYINQFFAGIGGEDKADFKPEVREEVIGPGLALQAELGDDYQIVATVICGDNYFGENLDTATDIIVEMVKKYNPDVFVAGPSFNAGRYGVACGTICKAVEEGYHERGIRVNYFAEERGSARAIKMLVKKMKGEEFTTDLPMPKFDRVDPAAPVKDIKKAKIAIVTSGGVVPQGNPDHIESSNATKYGAYSIEGMQSLSPKDFTTIHGGYDRQFVMENPNLVVPLDVLRELEADGEFGELYNTFFTTTGTGTATGSAAKMGTEIGKILVDDHVDAVILVST